MLEETLESPLDSKEIKPVNQRKSTLNTEVLLLKLQYFGHLMRRAESLEKTMMLEKTAGRRRRGQQRTRWLDTITNSMDMSLSKLREMEDREAWHSIAHGVPKNWTQVSN